MTEQSDEMRVNEMVAAFESLPILARIEFAMALICDRAGEAGEPGFDLPLSVAENVLRDVHKTLLKVPAFADLRS